MTHKIKIILLVSALSQLTFARIKDLETTRLQSSAGAGVGSILLIEPIVLNPAPMAFFDKSAIYYQHSKGKIDSESELRQTANTKYSEGKSHFFSLVDTSNATKGAFAYQHQEEFQSKRKRYIGNMATVVSGDSAIGLNYRYTKDEIWDGREKNTEKYHQAALGVSHILSEQASMGLVIYDLGKAKATRDTKTFLGMQYMISPRLYLLGDFGVNYRDNISSTAIWKAAVQVNFLASLFFRGGVYNDKSENIKGIGLGASWIGPKLAIDIAMKTSNPITDKGNTLLYNGEMVTDTSLSFSTHF